MENTLTPLARNDLLSLGVAEAASATEANIQRENLGLDTLIISNEEMNDNM